MNREQRDAYCRNDVKFVMWIMNHWKRIRAQLGVNHKFGRGTMDFWLVDCNNSIRVCRPSWGIDLPEPDILCGFIILTNSPSFCTNFSIDLIIRNISPSIDQMCKNMTINVKWYFFREFKLGMSSPSLETKMGKSLSFLHSAR